MLGGSCFIPESVFESIIDQVEQVFFLVWHWNQFENLVEGERVLPNEFTLTASDANKEFYNEAKRLNDIFWECCDVMIAWNKFEPNEVFEHSELDYYEDFEFEFDDHIVEKLFEMGQLHQTVKSTLQNKSGTDDYLLKVVEEYKQEERIRKEKAANFQSGGAKGNARKGRESKYACRKFIMENYPNGQDGRTISFIANSIRVEVEQFLKLYKKYEREELTPQDIKLMDALSYLEPLAEAKNDVLRPQSESNIRKVISVIFKEK